ncbi:hypothetical protein EU522_01370 [Candidatus Thorarchaeota archaeon]|nr:MAG: hypothetical protein EU522_01370 [Candidatus Thorarchaeota archaeon]
MTDPVTRLSIRISEKQILTYALTLTAGGAAFLILLFLASWDIGLLVSMLITEDFLLVSGSVTRFLSGTGIMLTYALFCILVFSGLSKWTKGSQRRANILKTVVMVPMVGVLAYAGTVFIRSLVYSEPLAQIEILTSLGGVWSLFIFVYLLPLITGKYDPSWRETYSTRVRRTLDRWGFKAWRGYQSYFRRDYGEVYSREFERYRVQLDSLRAILSGMILLPLAVIFLPFPPLAFVTFILWIRMFSLDRTGFSVIERAFLIIIALVVPILFSYMFLLVNLSGLLLYFDVAYGIGILVSIAALGIIIIRT